MRERHKRENASRFILNIDTNYNCNFQVHVAKTSSVPDHCRQYALSDPLDSDYQSSCDDHTHEDICDRCEELTTVLQEIEEAISKMPTHSVSEDTTQEHLFVFDQAKK